MKINKAGQLHEGLMPIRVLQHNLLHGFENLNSDFMHLAEAVIKEKGIDRAIGYSIGEEPAKCPKVIFNKMIVQESFLSYVWCNCFALKVLYEESIVKQSRNFFFGNNEEVINFPLATAAYQTWGYGISLVSAYSPWDTELPNPELYEEEDEVHIREASGLYISAMKFILAHEFAHIELDHEAKRGSDPDPNAQNIIFEKEADKRAMELVLAGINDKTEMTIYMGLLMGLCSILFFQGITKFDAYPDVDDRIDAFISQVNPDDDGHPIWGIATLAYKLWDRHYEKGLVWEENLGTPKDQYYSIKRQVEQLG